MKSSWKRLHPLFVSSFPLNQIFAIVSVLSSSCFVFLYFNKKKERVIYFLLPSSYFASYFLKKKKGFHLTSFAICHFLNLLFSKIYFVAAFVFSSSQLLLLHFSNQKKKTLPTFPFEGLFTLVSQGFRKSENQLTNLWREGERYFV